MKSLARSVFTLALALLVSAAVNAADDAKPNKAKGKARRAAPVFRLPADISLSAEQQAKFDAIQKEYAPRRAELQKKMNELLSDEQKAARREAAAKAKADGLKGRKANEAADAAANLTEAQKTQMADLQKEQRTLNGEIREKVTSILTSEQKAKLPPARGKKAKKSKDAA